MRGPAVQRALIGEELFPKDIDARVRKVLGLINHAIDSGVPFNGPEKFVDTPDVRALLRKAAANSIVLLKNDKKLLPLKPETKTIAVIGPNAKYATISGGGSAALRPSYTVSPLEGITESAKKLGAEVGYAAGVNVHQVLPIIDPLISKEKTLFEFWNEIPTGDFLEPGADLTKPVPPAAWSTATETGNCFLADGVVRTIPDTDTKVLLTCQNRTTRRSTRYAGSGYVYASSF